MVSCLRRGLVAGLLGGLLAGLFALVIGEKPLGEAIRLEEVGTGQVAELGEHDVLSPPTPAPVQVSRRAQRFGLLAATGLVGICIGGMFGVVFAAVRSRGVTTSPWLASLKLGAATWLAVAVLPSLKYPANPPGVGSPATVGARTGWYLAAVVLSVATALATWALNRRTRVPVVQRHLLASAVAAAGLGLVAMLPASSDPVTVPPALLWNFRLSAFGTSATLWLALAVVFGLLSERAAHRGAA